MDPTTLSGLAAVGAMAAAVVAAMAWKQLRIRELELAGVATDSVQVWRAAAARLTKLVMPPANEIEEVRAALIHAGRQAPEDYDRFLEERVVALIGGAVLGMLALLLLGGKAGFLLMLVSLYLGMAGPRKLLERGAAERRDEISAHLPSAVDLLMTSIDAGLSINQALARVARELERSSVVLSHELSVTSSETEAGVALAEALHRLARRVELDEMTGLCGVIAQAHELGAPIVETLNEYAESSRRMRMAMLEERAGKLVIKLTMPLAIFLLPAALIAILGPAAIQLMAVLKQ